MVLSASFDTCRVFVDLEPRSGAWNMAVDEMLLDQAVRQGHLSLRWYRWNEPTVSLGYFQEAGAIAASAQLRGLPVVRRISGGGAIVHDRELTYSCAVPAGHPLAAEPRALYTQIHERIVAVLAEWGVAARLRGSVLAERQNEFMCFGRGDDFDVVIGDHKILGSSQRRRKGAVLQHGSLVLRRSPCAPQFPGLWDLALEANEPVDRARKLAEQLADRVARLLSARTVDAALAATEIATAQRLARERFGEDATPRGFRPVGG
ncbi:MAG: lipoate--protein ligase [Planctomycetaceae bacterium]|nr:lipoate--protein ligase [Planctomycetaceae bacterium]